MEELIKLGLTPQQAQTVHNDMTIYCMTEKSKQKHNNRKTVSEIKKAVPIKKTIESELTGVTIVDVTPQITEIIFVINGKNYGIDDITLIEKIRQSVYNNIEIPNQKFVSLTGDWGSEQRKRGNQPKPLLKALASQYMDYFTGTDYHNKVMVGKIFALYLKDYKEKNNRELQHNITSLLR